MERPILPKAEVVVGETAKIVCDSESDEAVLDASRQVEGWNASLKLGPHEAKGREKWLPS